ncbi:MAG TPA: tripartite tricarboxylate transporter substrate binding protein [Ramlibacter sp.]|jgi:tripartite-type tricarboxylate transporter receptor subunit TctC|nr:tripartite tricarboxylate transporter substrate binding protein [Ramlibacter sp.]
MKVRDMIVNKFARMVLALGVGLSVSAHAQDYPNKPIKLIVPVATGAAFDTVTRLLAEKLRTRWGQPVIVENRAGASHNIGAEAVAKSAPDGYTLLSAPPPSLVINKSLFPKLSYDPDTLVPVSLVVSTYNVLVVNPSVPAENVQQLIAYAKANPDKLNYASSGSGSTPHLAAEMFKTMAGVKVAHIPYKGTSQAVLELLGGRVDIMFADIGLALPHIRSGKLRVLAVASEKRSTVLPETPAMTEVLPGFLSVIWLGIAAPPGTPPAIVNQFSGAIAEALKEPDVANRLRELNFEPIGSTPAAMSSFMAQERVRWRKVVRDSGATAEQ